VRRTLIADNVNGVTSFTYADNPDENAGN